MEVPCKSFTDLHGAFVFYLASESPSGFYDLSALLSQCVHHVGDRHIVRAIVIPLISEILRCTNLPVRFGRLV